MPNRPGIVPPARQSAIVFTTVQQLRQEPAPSTDERYAVVLELGKIFAWNLYGTDAHNGVTVITSQAGGSGTGQWTVVRSDDRGTDLVNANTTIYVSGKRTRVLPAAQLSNADSTYTLSTTGAVAGDEEYIVRNDPNDFAITIVNGGSGADNIAVMPALDRSWCLARFDGTNWIHLGSGISLAIS